MKTSKVIFKTSLIRGVALIAAMGVAGSAQCAGAAHIKMGGVDGEPKATQENPSSPPRAGKQDQVERGNSSEPAGTAPTVREPATKTSRQDHQDQNGEE